MRRRVVIALYVLGMITAIVAVDVLFYRQHFWLRLTATVGIVAVFADLHLSVLKRQ